MGVFVTKNKNTLLSTRHLAHLPTRASKSTTTCFGRQLFLSSFLSADQRRDKASPAPGRWVSTLKYGRRMPESVVFALASMKHDPRARNIDACDGNEGLFMLMVTVLWSRNGTAFSATGLLEHKIFEGFETV